MLLFWEKEKASSFHVWQPVPERTGAGLPPAFAITAAPAHSCVSAPFSPHASGLSCRCNAVYWSTVPSISDFRWLLSPLFLFSWRKVNTQSLCVAPNRCQWHPWSIPALRSIKEEPSCFTVKRRELTAVLCQPSHLMSLWSDSFHGLQVHVRNLFRILWPWKLPIKVPLWCFCWLWAS